MPGMLAPLGHMRARPARGTRRLSWRRPLARPQMSGERNPILTRFAKLAVAAAVATFVLIAVGGLVRATDSGLGCPDWPLCFGDWLPPADLHAWIEHTHRLTAAVFVGPLVGAVGLITVFTRRRRDLPLLGAAVVAGVLVIAQSLLGAAVVLQWPGRRARHRPPGHGPHRPRGGDLHCRARHPRTDAGRARAPGSDAAGRGHRAGDLRADAARLVGDRAPCRARLRRLPADGRLDPAGRRRQRAGGPPCAPAR